MATTTSGPGGNQSLGASFFCADGWRLEDAADRFGTLEGPRRTAWGGCSPPLARETPRAVFGHVHAGFSLAFARHGCTMTGPAGAGGCDSPTRLPAPACRDPFIEPNHALSRVFHPREIPIEGRIGTLVVGFRLSADLADRKFDSAACRLRTRRHIQRPGHFVTERFAPRRSRRPRRRRERFETRGRGYVDTQRGRVDRIERGLA